MPPLLSAGIRAIAGRLDPWASESSRPYRIRKSLAILGSRRWQRNCAQRREASTMLGTMEQPGGYFCQVRFLCRLARSCLRRLCLLILLFRRFFNEPILVFSGGLEKWSGGVA